MLISDLVKLKEFLRQNGNLVEMHLVSLYGVSVKM